MYRKQPPTKTSIRCNDSYEGETIESKMRRVTLNKEPITDSAELIYTERKDGVQPGYDIRTDRFEVAVEAFDKIDKTHKARREERHKTPEQKEADKIAREAKQNMGKEGEGSPTNN